jgi:hypothetical protein
MNVLSEINNVRMVHLECHDLRSGSLPPAALYWDNGYCRFLLKNLLAVSDALDEFAINYERPSHPFKFDLEWLWRGLSVNLGTSFTTLNFV